MREAYRGRAAAYEKVGELHKALQDHNQLVLTYAVEVEILTSLDDPKRDQFLAEAADAYRTRGELLKKAGQLKAAAADARRADVLEAEVKKLAAKAAPPDLGQIQLTNAWAEPLTVVIDGVTYRLEKGEQ